MGDNTANNMTIEKHLLNHVIIKDNIIQNFDINYIPGITHIINLMIQKFILAVIIISSNNNENIDTGNRYNFTIDMEDNDLAFREIISKL